MKLCKCPECGKGGLWSDGYFQQTQCKCPHCGSHVNNWKTCTDLQLVPVAEYEALLESNHGKDCAIAELSAELEKLVPVEQPDKGCEGCEYESDGCCMNRNIDDEKIETKDCFTPKPEPQQPYRVIGIDPASQKDATAIVYHVYSEGQQNLQQQINKLERRISDIETGDVRFEEIDTAIANSSIETGYNRAGLGELKTRLDRLEKESVDLGVIVYDEYSSEFDEINDRLDRLFKVNRNATGLLEANLNDSEAGAKKHIELMRKHIEMEREILGGERR